MTLGTQIKELRKKSDITQEDLAKLLGCPRGTVSNWEIDRSEPDSAMLGRIAKVFNVSLDYLMLGEASFAAEQSTAYNAAPPGITEGLSDEEKKQVEQFVEFIKSRRKASDEQAATASGQ